MLYSEWNNWQGGVLSLWLFNLYIDVIINKLVNSGVGCHIFDSYVGCIVYADDILLLSASIIHLQRMLDICYSVGSMSDITFNSNKSVLFMIGKEYDHIACDLD